ncbi:hypothetical protein Desku_1125 [Desulfofundulus kuznetsovii DSM 6115]|uniref:Uncharacterized protein n=1 Tax=Desulfofundulus kuznetsovii (strain DSM 6115 / VKM B-1805 / 17) TaxID=760568 RepID=A0AAU8PM93_DESK7|nr:hypothetical protein Desku_1125 [Desulfofundulus kuznetsovii DSM 6115]
MKWHDFQTDLAYSLEERENEMFDAFYYRAFPGLQRIELVTDIATQRKGIDKILTFSNGQRVTVDEKKRRTDYGDILLELWSVWAPEKGVAKLGWLYTAQCDYIVYAIMPRNIAYVLPTLLLRAAWATHKGEWLKKYPELKPARNKGYVTRNIAIPADILLNAIYREMRNKMVS